MAESRVSVVPLNGSNYPTWKIQCRMALMRDCLWNIVNGTEVVPTSADGRAKFAVRRDKALAVIVLSVNPSLLYLIGDPTDPCVVWKKLADQFEKKTWATKLDLRRRLHALRLRDGEPVQEHIKSLTEIFDSLCIAGDAVDAVSDEDRVVHLLASLPDSFSVLVTALEANENVPKMEVVTERLLHEDRKMRQKSDAEETTQTETAMPSRVPRRQSQKCYHCGMSGHIKRFCRQLKTEQEQEFQEKQKQKKSHRAATSREQEGSDSESSGFVATHALSVSNSRERDTWIVDSGATCHMCHDRKQFSTFNESENSFWVMGIHYQLSEKEMLCLI